MGALPFQISCIPGGDVLQWACPFGIGFGFIRRRFGRLAADGAFSSGLALGAVIDSIAWVDDRDIPRTSATAAEAV